MSMRGRRVCVLGAGIVAAATTYALARQGWDVTWVDAHPQAGEGDGGADGGLLGYSHVEPLAGPAALRALPGWMLSAQGLLRGGSAADRPPLRGLGHFIAACRPSERRATTGALLGLSCLSRRVLHGWLADIDGLREAARHAQPGQLVLFRQPGARAAAQRQVGWQRAHGCRQRIVEAAECVVLEPALAATGGGAIAFGVWTADEAVADAGRLADGLLAASGARRQRLARATGFETRGVRIAALHCEDGPVEADHFVLAGSAAAPALLGPLGMALPTLMIRGDSVSLPVVDSAAAPRAGVTDHGRRLVHTRLGDVLQVTGFTELCGPHPSVDARRVQALCAAVEQTFPGACDFADPQPRASQPPATPGGRPMVGGTRWPNLWINAGHGALGPTLAPGCAHLLAAMMSGRPAPLESLPFRVPG